METIETASAISGPALTRRLLLDAGEMRYNRTLTIVLVSPMYKARMERFLQRAILAVVTVLLFNAAGLHIARCGEADCELSVLSNGAVASRRHADYSEDRGPSAGRV